MKVFAALRELTWHERARLAWLLLMAIVMEIGVRVVSLPRLARWMKVPLEEASARPVDDTAAGDRHRAAEERALLVDRFYRRWPIDGSCLRRSLVLGRAVRDLEPRLLIGVAREDGEIRAHAWVEVEGRPVGREDGVFAPLRQSRPT